MHLAAAALVAALAGVYALPAMASSAQSVLGPALACASGYHTDSGGNCQPNVAVANRYCPDGLVFHPTFEGWRCDPPPTGVY